MSLSLCLEGVDQSIQAGTREDALGYFFATNANQDHCNNIVDPSHKYIVDPS